MCMCTRNVTLRKAHDENQIDADKTKQVTHHHAVDHHHERTHCLEATVQCEYSNIRIFILI